MFITTENEIKSLMPTAKWNRPQQLFGYIDEEERVALEPLLGTTLYEWLLTEYDRLRAAYGDITATTVRPTGKAKQDPRLAHADVTEMLEQIAQGKYRETYVTPEPGETAVPDDDLLTIRLIRICQQIEFYRMLSHKAGLLTVSFNEGGGANSVSADGYEPATDKDIERMTKDAFMSAGRSVDSLLLFLEADARGRKLFAGMWQEADAFYLNKDLLFQTAQVMQKYSVIKCRMDYVDMVHDIRFCQDTYLEPRVGSRLLEAAVAYANDGTGDAVMDTLLRKLRTALAFYVESRRTEIGPKGERLARRDSMTDAQQSMAMAEKWIEEHLDALGEAAVGTPVYNAVRERELQAEKAAEHRRRTCRERMEQGSRKLFTAFPHTHRTPELK